VWQRESCLDDAERLEGMTFCIQLLATLCPMNKAIGQ
jgi:hypothetical protein